MANENVEIPVAEDRTAPSEATGTVVPDVESGTRVDETGAPEREFVDNNEKWAYTIWGFIFGLFLGVLFGSIPACCCIREPVRRKLYLIGWAIGAAISLAIFMSVGVVEGRKLSMK